MEQARDIAEVGPSWTTVNEFLTSLHIESLSAYDNLFEILYTKLPYHNFAHAHEVLQNALVLCERCKKHWITYDTNVIFFACLGHDAGYAQDHTKGWCSSKEEYAAMLTIWVMKQLHIEDSIIQKVYDAIMATHKDATCVSTEEKIVRASDLMGMMESYDIFSKNSLLLKEEYELLHNTIVSPQQRQQMTSHIINHYLSQELHITPEYYSKQGFSTWHQKVQTNLDTFILS